MVALVVAIVFVVSLVYCNAVVVVVVVVVGCNLNAMHCKAAQCIDM